VTRSERIADKVRTATTPAKHLTKGELAQILSMSRPALDRRLNGQVPWSYEELETLALLLATTVSELVGENHTSVGDTP
jgi:hypothetical protein